MVATAMVATAMAMAVATAVVTAVATAADPHIRIRRVSVRPAYPYQTRISETRISVSDPYQ